MESSVEAIAKLPGIEGKIAVGLQPTGFGGQSQREISDELGQPQTSNTCTHCFFVAVDAPRSFQALAVSKTYGKWKTLYEANLVKNRNTTAPAVLACALPVEFTASAAAPKKEKPKVTSSNARRGR